MTRFVRAELERERVHHRGTHESSCRISSWRSAIAIPAAIAAQQQQGKIAYPPTKTIDHVDDYFGRKVADPYRWMEDLNAADVAAMGQGRERGDGEIPRHASDARAFRSRITELWNYPKVGLPFREANRLFYTKNSGLQKQAVYYMRASLDAPEQIVIDPNVLSPDGSVALSLFTPSPDGRYLAYGQSQGGSDWSTVYVERSQAVASSRTPSSGSSSAASVGQRTGTDSSIRAFQLPKRGRSFRARVRDQKLYYHALGTPQSSDRLIYERKDQPQWFVFGGMSDDGRFMYISVVNGTDPHNRLYVLDLGDPLHPNVATPVKPLFDAGDAAYSPIGNVGSTIYMSTDNGAPKYRVVAFDVAHPEQKSWRVVVPEAKSVIDQTALLKDRIAVNYLEDVKASVRLFSLDGKPAGTLALPGVGSLVGMTARADTPELFYGLRLRSIPSTAFRYDPATGKERGDFPAETQDVRPGGLRDATDIRDVERRHEGAGVRDDEEGTGARRLTPDDSLRLRRLRHEHHADVQSRRSRMDRARRCLRDGIHARRRRVRRGMARAGMFEKKQNVFDDFIAAGEYLIATEVHIALEARHRGRIEWRTAHRRGHGTATGVVRRRAAAVGVMDMLRYDKFTGGNAWAAEYGSATDSTAFKYLIKYSPLHNVKRERAIRPRCSPPRITTTAWFRATHSSSHRRCKRRRDATSRYSCACKPRGRTDICRPTNDRRAGGSVGVRRRRDGDEAKRRTVALSLGGVVAISDSDDAIRDRRDLRVLNQREPSSPAREWWSSAESRARIRARRRRADRSGPCR